MKEEHMIKLGVIGTGMIAKEFLPSFVSLPEYEVRGILSTTRSLPTAQELCRRYGIPCATDDFDVLCAGGIDTVYIALPNLLHYEYCVRALERGLNVIVEKPLCCRAEEAREVAALAEEKKRFLFEAITTVYLDAYRKIPELLPRIGEVKLVQSQFCQFSSRYEAFQRGEIAPVFDPQKAGGAMLDLNVYNLFFVTGLFGAPESAVYRPVLERGVDTSGVTVLHYPGFRALCTCAKSCGGAGWGLIQGTKGLIRTTGTPNWVGDVVLELRDGTVERFPGGTLEERCLPELRVFARAMETGDRDFCRAALERSLAVAEVMTAVRREAGIFFPGVAQ
jgi:predicted dehydrogenase